MVWMALTLSGVKAIQTIPFGTVDKIFLYWSRPFWSSGTGSIKLAWPDNQANPNGKSEWYKRIFAFDEVLNNSNVLVAWISGDAACHMETLTEDEVKDTCADIMRKFVKNPGIPRADKVMCSRWSTDPYTCGSYTNPNKEMCENPGYYETMGAPLMFGDIPRVLFAGEATIPWCYSTMHGGRSSGVREGERLARFYNKTPKSLL